MTTEKLMKIMYECNYKYNVPLVALEKVGKIKASNINNHIDKLMSRFGEKNIKQYMGGCMKYNVPNMISGGTELLKENTRGKTLAILVDKLQKFQKNVLAADLPYMITTFDELDAVKREIHGNELLEYDEYAHFLKLPYSEFSIFKITENNLKYRLRTKEISRVELPLEFRSLLPFMHMNFDSLANVSEKQSKAQSIILGVNNIYETYFKNYPDVHSEKPHVTRQPDNKYRKTEHPIVLGLFLKIDDLVNAYIQDEVKK